MNGLVQAPLQLEPGVTSQRCVRRLCAAQNLLQGSAQQQTQRNTSAFIVEMCRGIVIFDLPAVLSHDDALVFAPTCDASLMIIDEGGTTKDEVERSYQLLDGANIIGSVLNKVKYK